MIARVPYDTISDQIEALRLQRKSQPLTQAEKYELLRLRRIKISRDYRNRRKVTDEKEQTTQIKKNKKGK